MRFSDRGWVGFAFCRKAGCAAVGLAVAVAAGGAWAAGQPMSKELRHPAGGGMPTTRPVPTPPPGQRTALLAGQQPVTPGRPTTAPAGETPRLRCDELIYSFPDVWSGETVEHTWIVHNEGKGVLQVLRVQPTCGCTVAQYDKEIQPGGEGKITAKLATRGYTHEVTKSINVTTNDPANAHLTLQLKGKVKPRVSLDPPGGAQFPQVPAGNPVADLTKTVKLVNNTDKPLKLELGSPLPQSAFTCELKEIEAGKVYELTVTVDKTKVREGSNSARIDIKTGLAEEPNIYIPVNLYAPPLIQVSPSTIAVVTPVSIKFHRELTVIHNGAGPMSITEVTATDPAIQVKAQPVPAQPLPGVNPQAAAPAPQNTGRIWKVTMDIPPGWDPPVANPSTMLSPGTRPSPIEIIVRTDVKAKPEVRITVTPYPQVIVAEKLVDKPAPVETLKDNAGKEVKLGAQTGHVTVTAFFMSWCKYCKRMLPLVQNLSRVYAGKGVDFNLISLDALTQAAQVDRVVKDLGVDLPYLLDPRNAAGRKYGANRFPMVFVVGKNGLIQAVNQGCSGNFEQNLKTQIDLLLAGKDHTAFPNPQATTRPAEVSAMPTNIPPTRTPPSGPPNLVLDSPQQEMGAYKPGTAAQFNLYLRNSGSEPLNVTEITTSEGLKSDPSFSKVVPPNTPTPLRLQFTAPTQPGPFHYQLTIASNDPSKPKVTVGLNGRVLRLLEVVPPNGIDFGRMPRTWSNPRMIGLTWNGEGPLKILGVESSSPKFDASLKSGQEGPRYVVWVQAKPPFEVGEVKASITIKTDCKEQPTVEVPLRLVQPQRIEVIPAAVSVPSAARQQDATISIMNYGERSLSILGVKVSNDKIRTQFYPDLDGVSYRLRVSLPQGFTASGAGEKVTIRTDDPEYGEIVVPIKVLEGGQTANGRPPLQ